MRFDWWRDDLNDDELGVFSDKCFFGIAALASSEPQAPGRGLEFVMWYHIIWFKLNLLNCGRERDLVLGEHRQLRCLLSGADSASRVRWRKTFYLLKPDFAIREKKIFFWTKTLAALRLFWGGSDNWPFYWPVFKKEATGCFDLPSINR